MTSPQEEHKKIYQKIKRNKVHKVYRYWHIQTAFRLQVDKDMQIQVITGKATGLKSLLQHTHATQTHNDGTRPRLPFWQGESRKTACYGFLVAPASVPSKRGDVRGVSGGSGSNPKNCPHPPKNWVCPLILPSWPFSSSPPSYVSVCVPVLLSAACCLAGAQATHTETVRRLGRHKNLQGCSLFPQPSLSTIQINILGGAEKSEKKLGRPSRWVWDVCERRSLPELLLGSKKLICGG